MANGAERRKIQNRLAQRAYRKCLPPQQILPVLQYLTIPPGRNLREKNKEVEKLKYQLRKFEGGHVRSASSASSDASLHGSQQEVEEVEDRASYRSQSVGSLDQPCNGTLVPGATFPVSETSDELNFMFQDFPPELELSSGTEEMQFDGSNFASGSSDASAPASALHGPFSSDYRARSSSIPFTKSPEPEIFPPTDFLIDSTATPADMMGITSGSIDEPFALSFARPFPSPLQPPPMAIEPAIQDTTIQEGDALSIALGIDIPKTEPGSRWAPDSSASLLHFAVAGGQLETLKLLLQHHPPALDVQDAECFTPIQRAIMLGRTDMVEVLLKYGARLQ